MNIGDQAYEIVRIYSEVGCHRTGTKGARHTSRWLASELASSGVDVSFQKFPFHYFDAELSVWSDGRSIEAMPLYYSSTGQKDVRNPATGTVDAHADEAAISQCINAMVEQAKADSCDGLVLATQCPTRGLCAINREYRTDLDFPVILVAQNDLNRIQASGADIYFSASIRKRVEKNIVARFPRQIDARRIVVTTPISGWFQCAGGKGVWISCCDLRSQAVVKLFRGRPSVGKWP